MSSKRRERIEWMDVLRGMSIVLVTFNHAILFSNVENIAVPDALEILNEVFAPVRMPLMVFLSGLLISTSLDRAPREYFAGKIRRILWPYAIWSAILLVLLFVTQYRTTGRVVWSDSLKVLYDPFAHLWFLYYLFVFYVIAFLTRRISPLWIASCGLVAAVLIDDYSFRRFFILMAFFMMGAWASTHFARLEWLLRSKVVIAVAAVCGVSIVVVAFIGGGLRYEVLSAPLVAASIVLAIRAIRPVASLPALVGLRFIGRNSIVFYLVHWHFTSQTVQILSGSGNGWFTVIGGTIAGLVGGVLTCLLIRIIPSTNLFFELPTYRKARRSQKARPD